MFCVSLSTTRLERLITAEKGECCPTDVKERLAQLDALDSPGEGADERDRRALKTLGDETRYRITRLLVAADRALCVCEITPLVDVSESAVSHAMADLREAGLVQRQKRGRWRYYAPTRRTQRLLEALEATRADGR